MFRSLVELAGDKISVVNKPSVKLSLSADDWALYGGYDDAPEEYANRDNVAVALNDYIAEAINTSQSRSEAVRRCLSILDKYSDSGCDDTEGRVMLEIIITAAYGQSR
jgi:hypothetical protein